MKKKLSVGILNQFPMSLVFGGLEIQCLKTTEALRKIGVNAHLVDYHQKDDPYEILHIFGNPPSIFEHCTFAASSKKIIVSAVFGGAKSNIILSTTVKAISGGISLARQKNDHLRIAGAFKLADHIICLNNIEKDFVAERYNVPHQKLTVIPNGVDSVFFDAKPDPFFKKYSLKDYVLFTGNIIPRKNPLALAKALNQLGLEGVFIGKQFPTEKTYFEEFIKLVNMSPNLHWIDGLPNNSEILSSAYAGAKLFCLPSFAEGQSLSALEAMAANKPLILADRRYAYQPEFAHARKCDPNNYNSIYQALKEVFQTPTQYQKQLPLDYSWNNVAKKITRIYSKIN